MKSSVAIIAVLTLLASFWLPWWIVAPICFLVALVFKLSPAQGFLISFITVFIVWIGSIYYFDHGTVKVLVGDILGISAIAAPILSSIIGGLIAGLFGLAGSFFSKKPKRFVNG